MILYLDASALVKRYIAELGTAEVAAVIRDAAAGQCGLVLFPKDLPAMLAAWQQ